METQEGKQTNKQTKTNDRVSCICPCSPTRSGLSNLELASLLPCLPALRDTGRSQGAPQSSVFASLKWDSSCLFHGTGCGLGDRHCERHWTGSQTQELLSFPRLEDGAIPGKTRKLSRCGMLLCRRLGDGPS